MTLYLHCFLSYGATAEKQLQLLAIEVKFAK